MDLRESLFGHRHDSGVLAWNSDGKLCPYVDFRAGPYYAPPCVLLGAALLERRSRLTIPRWLVLLGDASYSIYLIHFMVFSTIARFAFTHWSHLPVPIGGWMLLFILLGVGAGIVTHYAVERPPLRALGKKSIGGILSPKVARR